MIPGEFKDFNERQEAQEKIGEEYMIQKIGLRAYLRALVGAPEMDSILTK